jgi:hypothetical protein
MHGDVAITPIERPVAETTPAQPTRSAAYEGYLRALRHRTRSIQVW